MVRMDVAQRVVEIVDKPHETDLNQMWGCIIWRPSFTEFLHKSVNLDGVFDFAKIMNKAIQAGLISGSILR
jgi:hypothetical protein